MEFEIFELAFSRSAGRSCVGEGLLRDEQGPDAIIAAPEIRLAQRAAAGRAPSTRRAPIPTV